MTVIAFDLDGTLIDCKARQITVLRVILKALHIDNVNYEEIWNLKREGFTTKDALILGGVDPETATQIQRNWEQVIEDWKWLSLDTVFYDTLPVLKMLKERNVCIGVVTARQSQRLASLQMQQLGLMPFISMFEVVDPLFASTAKAEVLKSWKVEVFIGDTEIDFQAATLAKVFFVGLSRGQRSRDYLIRSGVNIIYETLEAAMARLCIFQT
ncbi:MAG: HAD hydrolase-like protein [Deltaproteobacteria bacterium]|nr:HAD hydrolase-like protein [Deltaproteobacteria bacterium]